MAKLTVEQVVKQINNVDVNFINKYDLQAQDKKLVSQLSKEEKAAIQKYSDKSKLAELFNDHPIGELSVKTTLENKESDGDHYPTITYYYNAHYYIGDVLIESKYNTTNYGSKEALEVLKKFINHYEINKNNTQLAEKFKEVDSLKKQVSDLQETITKTHNPITKIKLKKECKVLGKTLDTLQPELSNMLKGKFKDIYDFSNFLSNNFNDETYNKAKKIVVDIEKKLQDKEEAEKEYFSYYEYGDKYCQKKEVLSRIEKRTNDAKGFKLVKYYRKHEEEFKNTRTPLIKIYAENLDENFMKELPNLLRAYDQAVAIAKEEGKVLDSLSEVEQYMYYDIAREIIQTNDKYFNTNKDEENAQ